MVSTEILHLSELAVGAGSPTASLVVDRLNKPALPTENPLIDIGARSQFQPTSFEGEYVQSLGLLGKMAATPAIIEPFRNPVTADGIFSCVVKLLNSRAEFWRQANRENRRLEERQLPRLWMLTPTASELLLNNLGFRIPEESEGWGREFIFYRRLGELA